MRALLRSSKSMEKISDPKQEDCNLVDGVWNRRHGRLVPSFHDNGSLSATTLEVLAPLCILRSFFPLKGLSEELPCDALGLRYFTIGSSMPAGAAT